MILPKVPSAFCPYPGLIWDKELVVIKRHYKVTQVSYSDFKAARNDARSLTYVVLFFLLLTGSFLKHKKRTHYTLEMIVTSPCHITLYIIFIPTLFKRPHIVHPS